MSGQMPRAVAEAAARHAQGAAFCHEAALLGISPRELAVTKARASILDAQDARKAAGQLTTAERWWQAAPHRIRVVLLNLGSKTQGDNFARARMPWAAFSESDQISIASTGAELMRGLVGVDCLGW